MRLGIKYQVFLLLVMPILFVDAFFTYISLSNSFEQADHHNRALGEVISEQLATSVEYSLLSGDSTQVQKIIGQTIDTNEVVYISVFDITGLVIAENKSVEFKDTSYLQYSYYRGSIQSEEIGSNDVFSTSQFLTLNPDVRILGWIHLYISNELMLKSKQEALITAAYIFIIILLVTTAFAFLFGRYISKPIFSLLKSIKKVDDGELGTTIEIASRNEFGDVERGFNSMSRSLLIGKQQLDKKVNLATLKFKNANIKLKRTNKDLKKARDNAQKANKIKSEFLANMSHEVRTPINGIQGFINLLLNTDVDNQQTRYAKIIQQSTNDLLSIVNEILDLSIIESGKLVIVEETFDLYKLVETTRNSLASTILDKNIDIYLSIYSDTPRLVIGDPHRTKQILINLIGNAIKFTTKGYIDITIYIGEDSSLNETICFQVEDTGIGISKKDQDSIFKAFTQIESDANRRYPGTGLGLNISKILAIKLGGDIRFESNQGTGSFFTLELPLSIVEADQHKDCHYKSGGYFQKSVLIVAFNSHCLQELLSLYNRLGFISETLLIESDNQIEDYKNQISNLSSLVDYITLDARHLSMHIEKYLDLRVIDKNKVIIMHYDQSQLNKSLVNTYRFTSIINTTETIDSFLRENTNNNLIDTNNSNNKQSNNHKVLVVDDNQINLTLAVELIKLWGHTPFKANDAKQAMDIFRDQEFDLILLDIQMPNINGAELLQMMKKEKPLLSTPVVAITANNFQEEKSRLLGLGFDHFISKPIDETKFKNILSLSFSSEDENNPDNDNKSQHTSFDFDLTLKLSGGSHEIADEVIDLLPPEISWHKEKLKQACDDSDLKTVALEIHKLQGITCYTGLPRLKALINDYNRVKNKESMQQEITVLKLCQMIINEMRQVEKEVSDFIEQNPNVKFAQ